MNNLCIGFFKEIKCVNPKKNKYFCEYHNDLEKDLPRLMLFFQKSEEEIISKLYFCKKCNETKYKYSDSFLCYTCNNMNKKLKCKAIIQKSNLQCNYNAIKDEYCKNHYYLTIDLDGIFTFNIPQIVSINWYKNLDKYDKVLYIKTATKNNDKQPCLNFIRACPNFTPKTSIFSINDIIKAWKSEKLGLSRCRDCKNHDNDLDKIKRQKIDLKNIDQEDSDYIYCKDCTKEKNKSEFVNLINPNTFNVTCRDCRKKNNIHSCKRNSNPNRKEYLKKLEAMPHMKEIRKTYKIINHEALLIKNNAWRDKKKLENPILFYSKQNAHMKEYRLKYPEKFENEKNRYKCKHLYKKYIYEKRANKYNIEFTLTDNECIDLFNGDCFYCSQKSSSILLNGIDRLYNNFGYYTDNCVSCCKMCNYIKYIYNVDNFYKMVEHILTYNKLIPNDVGELNYDLFENSNAKLKGRYNKYKSRAIKKNLQFDITFDDFTEITKKECYICGKTSDKIYINGIDRYNNSIGYVIENCKPCCKTCNYLKNAYSYEALMSRYIKIYNIYIYNNLDIELYVEPNNSEILIDNSEILIDKSVIHKSINESTVDSPIDLSIDESTIDESSLYIVILQIIKFKWN